LKKLTLGICFNRSITCSKGTCDMTSSSLILPQSLEKLYLHREQIYLFEPEPRDSLSLFLVK